VAGFYHPCDDDPYVIACFSCGVQYNCGNGSEALTDEELQEAFLDWHAEGCLWGDMRRDATAHSVVSCILKATSTDMLCTISTFVTPLTLSSATTTKEEEDRYSLRIKDRGYNSETDADLMEEIKRVREENEAKDARMRKLESIVTGIACHLFGEC